VLHVTADGTLPSGVSAAGGCQLRATSLLEEVEKTKTTTKSSLHVCP
jgi:hypothetical protein